MRSGGSAVTCASLTSGEISDAASRLPSTSRSTEVTAAIVRALVDFAGVLTSVGRSRRAAPGTRDADSRPLLVRARVRLEIGQQIWHGGEVGARPAAHIL